MIKVELEISDIEYEALVDQFLPVVADKMNADGKSLGKILNKDMTAGMAKKVLSSMSQEKKDAYVAKIVNSNRDKILSKIALICAQKGIKLKIDRFHIYAD